MSDLYIWIPNWGRFQQYKDRNPPWIKVYVELLSDDAYLSLTGHRRAVLHGIWLEFSRAGCYPTRTPDDPGLTPDDTPTNPGLHPEETPRTPRRLPADTLTLTRRLGLKVRTSDTEALNHAGFIEILASTMLAARYQDAINLLATCKHSRAPAPSQEAETETEKDKTNQPTSPVASYAAEPARSANRLAEAGAGGPRPNGVGMAGWQMDTEEIYQPDPRNLAALRKLQESIGKEMQ